MVLYGEEEEEMMANSEDPIIRTIWNNKIVAPYNAVPQIRPVYEGKKVFIDWKSGLEPAIFVRYSTPAGDPLIHVASNPVFMPNYPGWFFISTFYNTTEFFRYKLFFYIEKGLKNVKS